MCLTACGMPYIESSWEGMGKDDIAKILAHSKSSSVEHIKDMSWESKTRQSMINYCKKNNLSEKLRVCLVQMGMVCEENICRYSGSFLESARYFLYKGKLEVINYMDITVNLEKGWDSFVWNRKVETVDTRK